MAAVPTFCLSAPLLEIADMGMEPFPSSNSAILARLVSPSAASLIVSHLPTHVLAHRPLEVEFAAVGIDSCVIAAVARWLSVHIHIAISVKVLGQPNANYTAPLSARQSARGWIARALIHPATWTDAVSVSIVLLTLAGKHLPCHSLPATLRVGYNHDPEPMRAVYLAAKAGDVPALQAALDAGGSTEEANRVRGRQGTMYTMGWVTSCPVPFLVFSPLLADTLVIPILCCRSAGLALTWLRLEATLRSFARSLLQAPIRQLRTW